MYQAIKMIMVAMNIMIFIYGNSEAMKVPEAQYSAASYGNKTHNLWLLTKSCQDVTIGNLSYHVRVPAFVGFTSDEIKTFLSTKGVDIDKEWATLCAPLLPAIKQILETKQYPPKFLAKAEELSKRICACFQKNIFPTLQNLSLLTDAHTNGKRLMVRSTGKEDTDTCANAGGNETVANVQPTAADVSEAMGIVVASYIGTKSLTQRLAVAKDEAQVKEILATPFMPVLLQVMVGEKLGGEKIEDVKGVTKLPVSGVMFTTQADMIIPKPKDPKAEWQLCGITHLQTTFGHNEAVVNSLVPVDTWYIARDGVFYPVIRKKTHRYIPLKAGGVGPIANEKILVERPTLAGPVVRLLKQLADHIQAAYSNAPMDVELVIMPSEKTIYLVQARPIVVGEKKLSYVTEDVVASIAPENKIQGVKFGLGDGAVRTARGVAELLIYDKLDDALSAYFSMKQEQREQVKCVVIKEMAASTSHAATTFRAENMPIIQLNDTDRLSKWVENYGRIIVDIQRGLLLLLGDEDQLSTTEGWFECPLPRQLSVRAKLNDMPARLQARLKTLNKEELSLWWNKPIKELFELLKQGTQQASDQVTMSLLFILSNLKQGLQKQQDKEEKAKATEEILEDIKKESLSILNQAYVCAREIVRILPYVGEQRDLRMLFHANFLQALFKQQDDLRIINQYSLASVGGMVRQDVEALKESKDSKNPAKVEAFKLSKKALGPGTAQRWKDFVTKYFAQEKDTRDFVSMLVDLGNINMLPLWLNIVFDGFAKQPSNTPISLAATIIADYKKEQSFLRNLVEWQKQLDGFSIDQFAKPESFKTLWKVFAQTIELFKSQKFLSVFKGIGKNKNDIAQLAALNLMNHVVDVFDSSIKKVRENPDYPQDKKDANSREMIAAYWDLFKEWVNVVPGIDGVEAYIKYFDDAFTQGYIKETTMNDYNDYIDLDTMRINRQPLLKLKLEGIEDFFSFTHQNLLIVIKMLGALVIDIKSLVLPPIVNTMQRQIEGLAFSGSKPSLQTVSLGLDQVSLGYSLKLGDKSAYFELEHDAKETTLNASYLGDFAAERGGKVYLMFILATGNEQGYDTLSDIYDHSASFQFKLTSETDAAVLGKFLTWMNLYTVNRETSISPKDVNNLLGKFESYKQYPEKAVAFARALLLSCYDEPDYKGNQKLMDIAQWLIGLNKEQLLSSWSLRENSKIICAILKLYDVPEVKDAARGVFATIMIPEILEHWESYLSVFGLIPMIYKTKPEAWRALIMAKQVERARAAWQGVEEEK